MKKVMLLILSFFTLNSCSSQGSNSEISGEINGGLRYINMPEEADRDLIVYRGDYIVFELKDAESGTLYIPELEIEESLPNTDQPYVKMKKSGSYSYTLGNYKGIIKVIDYSESNYQEVTAAEAVDIINNLNPFILDVRTTGEYNAGHIPGASLIPVQILSSNIDKIEQYKNEPVFVYCQSGNRSTVASRELNNAGFTRVYNLRYGIGDWKRKGYEVE